MPDVQTKGPTRLRVALPTSGQWPRAGKVRLGTATPTGRTTDWGSAIVRPQKADHFVVREDESGITTAEAASAFLDAYGAEPRRLRFILPGDTPDENMEGAYRLYGANKLKIRCDGTTCSQRTATGWADGPCACDAKGLPADSNQRCTLTYTIQLILPDVAIPGIWQLDTGSEISSRRMADWLDMIYGLRGSLRGIVGDLFLVEQMVQPAGFDKSTKIYVLSPQARGATVEQLLSGGGAVQLGAGARAELPLPAADLEPEATLDHGGFEESRPASSSEDAAAHSDAGTAAEQPAAPGGTETVAQQIRGLGVDDKARLRARSQTWKAPDETAEGQLAVIKQTIAAVASYIEASYPGETVLGVLDQLDALDEAEATAQGQLD